MRETMLATLSAVLLVALFSLAAPAGPTAAQEKPADGGDGKPTVGGPAAAGPAPELGAVVLDDPLSGPAALWADVCASKNGLRQFVGEGLLFKVAGRCSEKALSAQITTPVSRLLLPDGELRLETKVVSGAPRAAVRLWVRARPGSEQDYYFIEIQPGVGKATIKKIATVNADTVAGEPGSQAMLASAGATSKILAERTDLAALFVPDGWNSVAVRLQGPKLWLLVNDQVALSAMDATHPTGEVFLGVARLGAVDDTEELALLLRNLRVSRLAQVEAGREPTYLQPPTPGAVVAEDALTSAGAVSAGTCATSLSRADFLAEGFQMTVGGRCRDTSTVAALSTPPLQGLTLTDGEVRYDLKAAGDLDRAIFRCFFRADQVAHSGYSVTLVPGRGLAYIYRWTAGEPTFITGRADLTWLYQPTDWNAVAIRVRGDQLWLLLNDQPVLFASDRTYGTGGASFDLTRAGSPDDQQEVKVTIRNLRLSTLTAG